jgi:hypothetical protein
MKKGTFFFLFIARLLFLKGRKGDLQQQIPEV